MRTRSHCSLASNPPAYLRPPPHSKRAFRMNKQGMVVWRDLMTLEPERAKRFYGELFDWEVAKKDGGPAPYSVFVSHGSEQSGVMKLDPAHGLPSHWIPYFLTNDVHEALERGKAAGGKVGVEPFEIPGIGTFAVMQDPQGAWFMPFSGDDMMQSEAVPTNGFAWAELVTTDPEDALRFYEHLFGYSHESADMGPLGRYHNLLIDGSPSAGVVAMPKSDESQAHWLLYVSVTDHSETLKKAVELGATVHTEAIVAPGIGTMSTISDPTGALVAFVEFETS